MSTYAIGDIQGCYKEFKRLLKEINFNKNHDTLWLAGDLVNRGPNSFDVIKYIMDLDSKAISVLGNHDFYLLASYFKAPLLLALGHVESIPYALPMPHILVDVV